MKKIVTIAAMTALVLVLAGCSSAPASSSSASESLSSASDVAESSSSQSIATLNWTDVKTADKAAKGAGFDKFGVMDKIEVDGHSFKDPTYSYADGVAQAVYESGAIGLIVRKADGKHTAPLTDRDKTEFAQAWSKSYEGLDVTLYGEAKGAATVFTWVDGTQEYGVTYQGLGGEEVSLDSDEVAAIVKGFKEANAKQEESKKEEQPEQQADDQPNNPLTEADVEDLVWENGLGELVSTQLVEMNDGNWYWSTITRDANGKEHSWMIDPNGNINNVDGDSDDDGDNGVENDLTEADVEQIVWENGLGEYRSSVMLQGDDGVWYWQVCTGDVNGDDHFFWIAPDGSFSEVEY